MRTRLLSTMLIGLTASGCASAGPGVAAEIQTSEPSSAPERPTIPSEASSAAFDPDTIPADATISVHRRGGVGATLFSLSVAADGQVHYQGVNLVETTGEQSSTLGSAEFAEAWRELVSLDRDHRQLVDQCTPAGRDGSTAYVIKLESGGDSLRFSGDLDAPCEDNAAHQKLVAQYHTLLTATGARAWVGASVK